MLNNIKKGLVVSCQALEDEPLFGSEIMKRMADAAARGGASAIRANGTADIGAIKQYIDLPVIGLIKQEYSDSDVYITPTFSEVEALVQSGADMIALDATNRVRPDSFSLSALMRKITAAFPDQKWMADCATVEECKEAQQLGFHCVGTTLYGYTNETKGRKLYDHDLQFLKEVINAVDLPVIAEGNILTPEMAARALQVGAHAVVVGGAITRPQQITARFVEEIHK
ncbi:N-acetylmannosamine-6-phosphate 2-epimerase [Jeotgalibacillus campisalis]|uniref:Putative N-acetylmannosamine-6-phosphate 2-epimerase n=1 Tax=Jeotgalibacillus campisalis TaxID=220754 RepID=A0A0C2RMT0_9BACL|nr:N-acetylmannosamine-6-phosphate 2-epimerase [Jeotgalibacillus campisalis]KIL43064.1 N-acetylmannosamine-6-phosphate 2-epimerase [Jeotgalibacillus campisalis]